MSRMRNVSASSLAKALASGQPVITAEITPPVGADPSHALEMAEALRGQVQAFNVTDGSRAVMGMSSLALCRLLLERGLEPILQLGCRDRNRIALQADLLGAHALGIRNVLCLTGDPVKAGNQPEARAVFDLESVRLLRQVQQLNGGSVLAASPWLMVRRLCSLERRLIRNRPVGAGLKSRMRRKAEAGARFVQTQMVMDASALQRFCTEIAAPLNVPVLAGVFLLKSAKNAAFINRVVPGAQIPQPLIDRLAAAENPRLEGIRIAAEQVQTYSAIASGVHLMAVKAEESLPQVLELAGLPKVVAKV